LAKVELCLAWYRDIPIMRRLYKAEELPSAHQQAQHWAGQSGGRHLD
jgi:hypothetical protein